MTAGSGTAGAGGERKKKKKESKPRPENGARDFGPVPKFRKFSPLSCCQYGGFAINFNEKDNLHTDSATQISSFFNQR